MARTVEEEAMTKLKVVKSEGSGLPPTEARQIEENLNKALQSNMPLIAYYFYLAMQITKALAPQVEEKMQQVGSREGNKTISLTDLTRDEERR